MPVSAVLDATAPGLMFGLGLGKLGCFFTGCCAGRPTASRWGLWSSNRRVGARRIPTQLTESALALGVGATALVAVLAGSGRRGAVFVGALALFTVGRQALLQLREERRQTRLGSLLIAGAAAAVLVADGLWLALAGS